MRKAGTLELGAAAEARNRQPLIHRNGIHDVGRHANALSDRDGEKRSQVRRVIATLGPAQLFQHEVADLVDAPRQRMQQASAANHRAETVEPQPARFQGLIHRGQPQPELRKHSRTAGRQLLAVVPQGRGHQLFVIVEERDLR